VVHSIFNAPALRWALFEGHGEKRGAPRRARGVSSRRGLALLQAAIVVGGLCACDGLGGWRGLG